MKNHIKQLNLSFNGRLKNYFKNDGSYHNYNVGDLIMIEDKRLNGNSYIEVAQIIKIFYDKNYDLYQITYVGLSTGSCDYGCNTMCGSLKEIDSKVIKHLPKYCIDDEIESVKK